MIEFGIKILKISCFWQVLGILGQDLCDLGGNPRIRSNPRRFSAASSRFRRVSRVLGQLQGFSVYTTAISRSQTTAFWDNTIFGLAYSVYCSRCETSRPPLEASLFRSYIFGFRFGFQPCSRSEILASQLRLKFRIF